jgi:hypothetical protein
MPATANSPNDSARRPSTCTMPRSWSISALGRGLPSALTRGTTSVLMASATTSCTTAPRVLSTPASTKIWFGGSTVIHPPALPASSTKARAMRLAPMKT